MLSPLSRGYGTWTGNYDPYNDDGLDSTDSLPEIDDPPHRHGITVGFVSRTPSATPLSPPFRASSSHRGREASLSASTSYHTREATLSGKRTGSGRETSPMHTSRENSDAQMHLPKTFLTRKGALLLFAASEEEDELLQEQAGLHPKFMRIRKPVDVIDSSLKLGTLDKLAMSVLQFGEEELEKETSNLSEEKKKLFMKFLNKVDERDVDEHSQPGGDVMFYLRDLKHKTSLQMGLGGYTALPRSREALELRAILRGLQNDNWPITYKQDGPDFKQPSALAYQFSRPPSNLHHPPRNQYQRILSSKKLEESVQSLRSYLGRSLDDESSLPLLTRRRAKHKQGDLDSARRSKYSGDEDFRKNWSQRPPTNTPTPGEDLHDEESRDKLGEITDSRLPRDDRGRIDMIEIPHPTTPRSTEITTEDKVSPRNRSESSSKLGEKIDDEVGPETLVSVEKDIKGGKIKTEFPSIPDFLKPKNQPKPQLKKDQKKKGLVGKGKGRTTASKDMSKAIDITSVQPDQQDEITQIIKKKVTLPPENEQTVMPDFVSEALKRSAERSKQQLEKEFKEQQELIGKEFGDTIYEVDEGMTAEELELAKKALRKMKSQKSLTKSPDPKRLEEIRALEEKIAAQSSGMSEEEKKFRDKLQNDSEVQLELERIEREAHMAEQTEADVRQALKEDRMKRLEEKARQKKEELARKRQMMLEKKQQERQMKEEARRRELQKIMMLMDDEERKRRQEEERLRQEEEEREEEKRRKEEEEEMARLDREEEERRRQLEEEIEQEQLKRLQEEQDELRRQQELIAAQKQALLEEQRRKRELAALEEERQREELEQRQREEMRKLADERARIEELQKLEEEVRESMKLEMERRREEAIKRREYNIEARGNLNRIRHSQGINRAWVWSYFIPWPIETYMRPIGDQEKKKKEAKLRAKRMKAR